jgi:hypothetical protein
MVKSANQPLDQDPALLLKQEGEPMFWVQLRFFEKMTPAGPGAELSPSLADFGDAEVAAAEAAIEGRPTAAGPEAIPPVEAIAIPPVEAIAIPPVEAIAIPPVEAPDIKVPEITADAEQAEQP